MLDYNFYENNEPPQMLAISQETRSKWAARIRNMITQEVPKGSFGNYTATELQPEVAISYQISTLARMEEGEKGLLTHSGPVEYPSLIGQEKGGGYDVRAEKYSVSSVYQSDDSLYDHGEVSHDERHELADGLRTLIERVFEKFDIKCVVNPSDSVISVAKKNGVFDVLLDVLPENREQEERRARMKGMNVIKKANGIAFVGREGNIYSYSADEWVALCPIPNAESNFFLERIVVSNRWHEKVRSHEYWFDSPYRYMNQLQTAEFFGVAEAPRVFAYRLVRALDIPFCDQQVGEYRYIDKWPEVEQVTIAGKEVQVRKSGDVYYDYLGEKGIYSNLPISVRRGFIKEKKLTLAPLRLIGKYGFTIGSLLPVPVNIPKISPVTMDHRFWQNKVKKKLGVFWSSHPKKGYNPLFRGFFRNVSYYESSGVIYCESGLSLDDEFFVNFGAMMKVLETSYVKFRVSFKTEAVPTPFSYQIYSSILEGREEEFSPAGFSRLNWRLIPKCFIESGKPKIFYWNIEELNQGAHYSVLILLGIKEISEEVKKILLDSQFILEWVNGILVLRDLASWTGNVVRLNVDSLSFSPVQKRDVDFDYEKEYVVTYDEYDEH